MSEEDREAIGIANRAGLRRQYEDAARMERLELHQARKVKDRSAVPAMFVMAGVFLSSAAWLWWGGFGLLTVGGLLAGAGLLAALGYALLED